MHLMAGEARVDWDPGQCPKLSVIRTPAQIMPCIREGVVKDSVAVEGDVQDAPMPLGISEV